MKKIILILLLTFCSIVNAQWIQQSSGTTVPLRRVKFINVNTGWCAGENGIILKTTNGGTNWTNQLSGVTNPLFGLDAVNDSVVYAVGWYEIILKTTNGGTNWIALENDPNGDSYFSCFFS